MNKREWSREVLETMLELAREDAKWYKGKWYDSCGRNDELVRVMHVQYTALFLTAVLGVVWWLV